VKFITSIWDDPIEIDEVEVHYSHDGRGRASIVRRPDGLLCIYKHWKASAELHQQFTGTDAAFPLWRDDKTPLEELYRDVDPEIGLYGELEDARKVVLKILHRASARALT
jgi:hypothetical protein